MLSTTFGQGAGEAQNWLDNTYTNLISKIGLGGGGGETATEGTDIVFWRVIYRVKLQFGDENIFIKI
jgi:hypothetical protein